MFFTRWSRKCTVPAAGTFSNLFLREIEAGESARPILVAQMSVATAAKTLINIMKTNEPRGSRKCFAGEAADRLM